MSSQSLGTPEIIAFSGQASSFEPLGESSRQADPVYAYIHPHTPAIEGQRHTKAPQYEDSRFAADNDIIRTSTFPDQTGSSLAMPASFTTSSFPPLPTSFPINFDPHHFSPSNNTGDFAAQAILPVNLLSEYKPLITTVNSNDKTSTMAPGPRASTKYGKRKDQQSGLGSQRTRSHARRSRPPVIPLAESKHTSKEVVDYSTSENSNSPHDNSDNLEAGPQPEWMPSEAVPGVRILQNGVEITPTVQGRFEKSFFYSSETHDWTCYRRNYFQIHTGFTLSPWLPFGPNYELDYHGRLQAIEKFAMTICAVVDTKDGKSMPLIQHTAKRDKGPQNDPRMEYVCPRIPKPHHSGLYGNMNGIGGYQAAYEAQPQPHTIEFTRIQFKNATANNGKRRAAQQFYHTIAELYADLGDHLAFNERYVLVARQFSNQVVCRGRSPGHYNDHKNQEDHAFSESFTSPNLNGPSEPDSPVELSAPYGFSEQQQYGYTGYDTRSQQTGGPYSYYQSVTPVTPALSDSDVAREIVRPAGYRYHPSTTSHEYIPAAQSMCSNSYYQNQMTTGPYTPGSTVYSPSSSYPASSASPHYYSQSERTGSFASSNGLEQALAAHSSNGNGLQYSLPGQLAQEFPRLNLEQRQLPPLSSNWRIEGLPTSNGSYHYSDNPSPQPQMTYTASQLPTQHTLYSSNQGSSVQSFAYPGSSYGTDSHYQGTS